MYVLSVCLCSMGINSMMLVYGSYKNLDLAVELDNSLFEKLMEKIFTCCYLCYCNVSFSLCVLQ